MPGIRRHTERQESSLPRIAPSGRVPTSVDRMLSTFAASNERNDQTVRNQLFFSYQPRLQVMARSAWRRNGQQFGIERDDADQEAFIVFANLLSNWSGNGSLSRYVLGSFSWRMRDAMRAMIPARHSEPLLPDLELLAECSFDVEQTLTLLTEIIDDLPPFDRQIVWLKVARGKSNREIAKALGVSSRTIRRRWSRRKVGIGDALRARDE